MFVYIEPMFLYGDSNAPVEVKPLCVTQVCGLFRSLCLLPCNFLLIKYQKRFLNAAYSAKYTY